MEGFCPSGPDGDLKPHCNEAKMPETTQSDNLNGNADASVVFKYSHFSLLSFQRQRL